MRRTQCIDRLSKKYHKEEFYLKMGEREMQKSYMEAI